ncbi:MAG TPA: metallophosphoesterase [Methylocella sp.]|jgi:3',5'-cyclic AMP phosphodiesterase CpdA
MGLIVHLTDLHLGLRGAASPTDDRKILVVNDDERMTRRDEAEAAIKKLTEAIKANGKKISALVISGDITVAGSPEGFEDLKVFLADSFGTLLPDASRIVAVPGNHDVKWFERDAAKRYDAFNEHCVKAGFVTPPLEGLTLVGEAREWTATDRHVLVDVEERWAVVPINSAEFSGVRSTLLDQNGNALPDETAVDAIEAELAANPLHAAIFKQLREAREYDMARVSKMQIKAFGRTIEYVEKKFAQGAMPLLFATLHHQLSPVDDREEIKPFEALSNLGRVRSMLQEAGVSIIFHGHKHQSRFFWDSREDASADGRTHDRHDMLVLSGGTVGGGATPKESLANVVEITPRPHGHDVKVWSLGDYVEDSKNRAKQAIFFDRRRLSPIEPSAGLIEGETFDEAYARLEREAALAGHGRVNDLVVRIRDGRTVTRPPSGYPADASGERGEKDAKLDEWFKDITLWWQSPLIEAPDRLFTHGRRLQLYDGKRNADQIKAIARIIKRERMPGNGRAVATLINPETDTLLPDAGVPMSFPAFCLVQLHVSNDGRTDRLDATAYFRKQEIRYWWPVNVAEIKFIMSKVVEGMRDIEIGSITTVAAIAVWQPSRSRVAIPKVDRLYFQDHDGRTTLSRMAALLSGSPAAAAERSEHDRTRRMWRAVLDDIVPPGDSARDSIPLAVEGIAFLRRSVEAQLAVNTTKTIESKLRRAAAALKALEGSGIALRTLSTGTDQDDWKAKLEWHVKLMSDAKGELSQLIVPGHKKAK